jgi:predicted deacetylase
MEGKTRYIFRLDDICPRMNWEKFLRLEKIFLKYNIKPIIGIIPNNKDKSLNVGKERKDFWQHINMLVAKGWIVAQHGYDHTYTSKNAGIMKIGNNSEFAGKSYKDQFNRIKEGNNILKDKLRKSIEWWVAPNHSYDEATCRALEILDFKYITDGFFLKPVVLYGLIWVPQQLWKPRKMPFGLWTVCIHPNTYNDFDGLENFIKENLSACKKVDITEGSLDLNDKIFSWFWHRLLKLSQLRNYF